VRRTIIVVGIAFSVVIGCLMLRSGAQASTVHRYRCLGDALASTQIAIHVPGSERTTWKVFARDGGGAVINTVSSPQGAHQTTITTALGIEFDVTSRRSLLVTAAQGAGDAIHTLRCT